MDPSAKAAVRTGDDVLASDGLGEGDEPVGDEFRVFHDVGGVADYAGDEDLAFGQFHIAPDFVFMLVTHVARFDGISLSLDLEHDVHDVA